MHVDLDRLANQVAELALEIGHPALVQAVEHGHAAAHDAVARHEVVGLRRTGRRIAVPILSFDEQRVDLGARDVGARRGSLVVSAA